MEITLESLPWDSEDVDNWSAFLRTKAGQRLIPKLAEHTPELLSAGDTNAILIRSGEVRAMAEVIKHLLSFATHPVHQTAPVSEYPPLTDDAAWNDGQKIQP